MKQSPKPRLPRGVRVTIDTSEAAQLDGEQLATRRAAWFDALWLACGGHADAHARDTSGDVAA